MREGKSDKKLNIQAVFDVFQNKNSKHGKYTMVDEYNGKYVVVKHNILLLRGSLEVESDVILATDDPADVLVEINDIDGVNVLYDKQEWDKLSELELQDIINIRFDETKW